MVSDGAGAITNCSNYGTVISINNNAFGITDSMATVNKCFNVGDITGKIYVGGLCGQQVETTLNSFNLGKIKSTDASAAGIKNVTMNACYNCYNIGDVTAGYIGVSRWGLPWCWTE